MNRGGIGSSGTLTEGDLGNEASCQLLIRAIGVELLDGSLHWILGAWYVLLDHRCDLCGCLSKVITGWMNSGLL